MKLNNENVNGKREAIDRDIRMLECIESMHKNMEYEVSCEDPDVSYISIDGLRLIFNDGKFKGWYAVPEEEKEKPKSNSTDAENEGIYRLKEAVYDVFNSMGFHITYTQIYEGEMFNKPITIIEIMATKDGSVFTTTLHFDCPVSFFASIPISTLTYVIENRLQRNCSQDLHSL